MDRVTGALPGSRSSSQSMWSWWAESEAQVLRSERSRQLRHGSDRSQPPRRPGRCGGARRTWRASVQCGRPLQIRPDRYVYRDDASCCAPGRIKQGQSSRPFADRK